MLLGNLKKFAVGLVLMMSMVILVSCVQKKKENEDEKIEIQTDDGAKQLEYDLDEPLVVFYGEAGLLTNFTSMYPEIPLKTYRIYSNVNNESVGLDYWIKKYGEPDIILLREWSGFDIEKEYQEGRIKDIRQYMLEDETLSSSDYISGTFEVMDNGEALLGLPLSWYKRCLIVRNPKVENSVLATLSENYTGKELFNALWQELQKEEYYDTFFWTTGFGLLNNLGEMNEFQFNSDDEVVLDEELFELLYKFEISSVANYNSAKESFGDWSGYLSQYNMNPALEPEMLNGNYFGCLLWGAPQVTAIYAKSVAEIHQQGIQMYWIPEADNGEAYTGLVVDFALIGGNSARQKQAYEMIRLMMDMPIEIITQPESGVEEIYSPVNIECALEMLEYFDSQESDLFIQDRAKNPVISIEKQKLSREEKEKIQDVITGMSSLYLDISRESKKTLQPIFASYEEYCLEGGRIDHKSCYYEFMRYLDPENEEWNMSPEELDAYLDSDGNTLEGDNSPTYDETEEKEVAITKFDAEVEKLKDEIRNTDVGDIITFGETEQDNNLENGNEPIEWIILSKEEDQVFVISKDVIEYLKFTYFLKKFQQDSNVYYEYDSEFSWELKRNNQLAWLEGELYQKGFDEVEKSIILLHENKTVQDDNSYIYQSEEYLYVPTKEEVEEYVEDEEILRAEASDYVLSKMNPQDDKYVSWSLRNEGYNFLYAMEVLENGEINTLGHLNKLDNGVRPVMWLDIS